jgi:hypothetical protein
VAVSKLAPGHMGPVCERFSVRNAPFSGVILCNSGASSSKEYGVRSGALHGDAGADENLDKRAQQAHASRARANGKEVGRKRAKETTPK